MTFGLSFACYNMVLFVILLQYFIFVEVIQIGKRIRSIEDIRYDHQYIEKPICRLYVDLLCY